MVLLLMWCAASIRGRVVRGNTVILMVFLIISTVYLVMHSLFSTREKFWNFQAHLQKMEIPHEVLFYVH